jgi:hypothetical protein
MTATRLSPIFRRRGQVMILLVVFMVILLLIGLWNFDLHKIVRVKQVSRNGGDAAALAAARWQAMSLNMIGELNILQAAAISDALAGGPSNGPAAAACADLQARLCFVGPLAAVSAAQLAAKNNGIYNNSDFTRQLVEHAALVRSDYDARFPTPPYDNGPGAPSCWIDYADMLDILGSQGIAAEPDSYRFYHDFSDRDHFLLNPSFYEAVASRGWCWFFFNAMSLLENYRSWHDWPALPVFDEPEPMNAEYFCLFLRRLNRLDNLPLAPGRNRQQSMKEFMAELNSLAQGTIDPRFLTVDANWYCYQESEWTDWTERIPDSFPFLTDVRDVFNYAGADAAVRIETGMQRLTPGSPADTITWSAAAKPFGTLGDGVRPNRYGLVLPAYTDIRLIPVDTSSAPAGGSAPGWAAHIYDHLDPYLQRGLDGLTPACWYCDQLRAWEPQTFRTQGVDWLEVNSQRCQRPGNSGTDGGGTRRGH